VTWSRGSWYAPKYERLGAGCLVGVLEHCESVSSIGLPRGVDKAWLGTAQLAPHDRGTIGRLLELGEGEVAWDEYLIPQSGAGISRSNSRCSNARRSLAARGAAPPRDAPAHRDTSQV
jgi:hypothetical protein